MELPGQQEGSPRALHKLSQIVHRNLGKRCPPGYKGSLAFGRQGNELLWFLEEGSLKEAVFTEQVRTDSLQR